MHLEIDEGYHRHPKTVRLKGLIKNTEGDVFPPRLWSWAIRSSPWGNLTGLSPTDIEGLMEYRGEPGALYRAMVEVRLIDVSDDETITIHNWHTRMGKAIRRMEKKAAELKQRRAHAEMPRECDGAPACPICKKLQAGGQPVTSEGEPRKPAKFSAPPAVAEKGAAAMVYDPEFLRVYDPYPRKEGKKRAYGAWIAAGKPTELILAALNGWQLEDYRKRPPAKVPLLVTHIEERYWEDSPPPPKNGHGKPATPAAPTVKPPPPTHCKLHEGGWNNGKPAKTPQSWCLECKKIAGRKGRTGEAETAEDVLRKIKP